MTNGTLPTVHPERVALLVQTASFEVEDSFQPPSITKPSPVGAASTPATKPSRCSSWTRIFQYIMSVALLGTCVALCTAGILTQQTPVSQVTHPLLSLGLMWVLIIWLGILEGGQGCLVGLQPIERDEYRATHPHTFACMQLMQSKDDLHRFIVGRQFLVILVIFLLNLCCTTFDGAVVPYVPPFLLQTLLTSGLAVMLVTLILGQLAAQVNATNCMLDFINTPLVIATTAVCLIIEESGILHAVYLVQCFFTNEAPSFTREYCAIVRPKSPFQHMWHWLRVFVSVGLLAGSLFVTCAALWHGETTMYPRLSTVQSFLLFFGLVCFLGLLEAIQIAIFAVAKLPPQILAEHPAADANCQLVFDGRNFKATLIGRQICVTTCVFLLARITTTDVDPEKLLQTSSTDSTILGVPPNVQDFFNTGLPGALITTVVASLIWRIVASSYPIVIMANPVVHYTIRLCLCLEASGIFSSAWLMADAIKWICGFRPDDVYLRHAPANINFAIDTESITSDVTTSDVTMSTRRSDLSVTDYGSEDLS